DAEESYKQYVAMHEMMCEQLMSMDQQLKRGLTLLRDNYTQNSSWYIDELRHYKNEEVLRTYVHGDLWAPNILWRGDDVAAIVDWSLCHAGSLTEDLQRVLVTCCSVERRKRIVRPLLEYYFDRMGIKLGEKGMDMPFTFKDLEEDYHRTLRFTSGQTVFATGLWLQTGVIRRGKSDDVARVQEILARLSSVLEETALAYKWHLPDGSQVSIVTK
ncbi:CHK domain-containing protein, partial [Trichostrongylus colubriformis]